ncbi:MAG: hypothetical protein WBW85_03610 [Terriglobales bacterium]
MKCNRKMLWMIVAAALVAQAGAQVLTGEQVQKIAPSAFFYAGQSASVQMRNTGGVKNSAGKLVLAGLVDTGGYATSVAEKYQGFFIAETKVSFEGAALDPGEYGFGFVGGKFVVTNVAGTEVISVASKNDEEMKRPVPLKFEKDGDGYRLYAGRKYAAMKVE